ncbi:nuclear receptor coactivator 4 [Sigmodon hispidus]
MGQFNCLIHQLEYTQNKYLTNQVSLCLERLGSLALKPEDSTVLLFEAGTSALRQTITSFGSLKTIQVPEHLMAHASTSHIGPFLEKRGYIQVPEQKSASSSTALSEWLLVSKPAIGHQAPYVPSTNPQDWLTPKQTLENSQTSPKACSFFSNADWVLPGKKVGNLNQFSGEDKCLLRKKAQYFLIHPFKNVTLAQIVMASQQFVIFSPVYSLKKIKSNGYIELLYRGEAMDY